MIPEFKHDHSRKIFSEISKQGYDEFTLSFLKWFLLLLEVPHPSGSLDKMTKFIVDYSESQGLDHYTDEYGNIVVKIPGNPKELEGAPSLILQGHIDMVSTTTLKDFDFTRDPIRPLLELDSNGDTWLTADETTLGADDGVGVAGMMNVMSLREKFPHGPLELLFTVDEEVGLLGAKHLSFPPGVIESKVLLNLDSEERKSMCVGSAGAVKREMVIPMSPDEGASLGSVFRVRISGLVGGHTGIDITKDLANAIDIITRIIFDLIDESLEGFRLLDLSGGNALNAIPSTGEFTFSVSESAPEDKIRSLCTETFHKIMKEEYFEYEVKKPTIVFEKLPSWSGAGPFRAQDWESVLDALVLIPHGVIKMNRAGDAVTSTSLSLASVKDDGFHIGVFGRSQIVRHIKKLERLFQVIAKKVGGKLVGGEGDYSPWQPDFDSKLLKIGKEAYKRIGVDDPKIYVVNGGLETSIINQRLGGGLDMLSIGPTIYGAHSVDERLLLDSAIEFNNLVKEILVLFAKGEE